MSPLAFGIAKLIAFFFPKIPTGISITFKFSKSEFSKIDSVASVE